MTPAAFPFSLQGYIAWCATLCGLSARTRREDYGAIVAPSGPAAARAFLSGITPPGAPSSGCMVAQCGAAEVFFAAHGKPCPLIAPVGFDRWHVMTEWAAANRALLAPGQWAPEPGDIVLQFLPPNHQHWVGLLDPMSALGVWRTWEGGGTPDAGWQHIEEGRRHFQAQGSKWIELESAAWHSGVPMGIEAIVRVRTLIENAQTEEDTGAMTAKTDPPGAP